MVLYVLLVRRGCGEVFEIHFEGVDVSAGSLMLSVKRELVFWTDGLIDRPELGATLVGLGLNPRLGMGLLISKFPRHLRRV